MPVPQAHETALVQIGDVVASRSWISTPSAAVAIRGATVTVYDLTRQESRIPAWAIVLAVVGALFFLLGLFFLLARETFTSGWVQVSVQNGAFMHTTQVPVSSVQDQADTHARVAYLRQLIAAADAT